MNTFQTFTIYCISALFIIVSSYIFFKPSYTAFKKGSKILLIPRKCNFLFITFTLTVSILIMLRLITKMGIITGVCLLPTILYIAFINICPLIIFKNGILHHGKYIEWNNIDEITISQNNVTIYTSFANIKEWQFKICDADKEIFLKILNDNSVLVKLR